MEPMASKQVKLNWKVPDDIHGIWSENFAIQTGQDGTMIVSFFQQKRPLLIGTPEEQAETLNQLESIDTVCVAQVVIPMSMVGGLISVMANTLNHWQTSRSAS